MLRSKKKKLFVSCATIVLAIALCVTCLLTGCQPKEESAQEEYDSLTQRVLEMENPDPLIKLEDVQLPEGMRKLESGEEAFGLFWCLPKGKNQVTQIRSTSPEAENAFDPTKPTIVYFHGMALNTGWKTDEDFYLGRYYLDQGYNVAIFNWSQFADYLLPWGIEPMIWGHEAYDPAFDRMENILCWRDEDGAYRNTAEENPDYSLSEIFAAYYLDFMLAHEYTGKEIHFIGLSMGGQLVSAAASYLVTKEMQGLLSTSLIPDRVTMFDPYVMGIDNPVSRDYVYCSWFKWMTSPKQNEAGEVIKDANGNEVYTTVGELLGEALLMMHNRGVAIEYIPTPASGVIGFLGTDDAYDLFYSACSVLEFNTRNSEEYSAYFHNDAFNRHHLAGREWYAQVLACDPDSPAFFDRAAEGEYALSTWTPTDYTYFRAGVVYSHDSIGTLNPADDMISSTNITSARVAGFAFADENNNGVYDDRIKSRLAGVEVKLYAEKDGASTCIGTTVTFRAGAYAFDIEESYIGSGYEFYIEACTPEGYAIAKSAGIGTESNGLTETGKSARFTLAHNKALKIVDLGFVK